MVTKKLKLRFYADDIQAVCSYFPEELSQFAVSINEDLNRMYEWCANNGLILNGTKTRLMNFNNFIPNSNFKNLFFIGNKHWKWWIILIVSDLYLIEVFHGRNILIM